MCKKIINRLCFHCCYLILLLLCCSFITSCDELIDFKVEKILSKMTLEQKIGQMTQPERSYVEPGEIKEFYLGSMLSGGGSNPGSRSWNSPWEEGEDPWLLDENIDMPDGNSVEDWRKMHDIYQAEIMSEKWISKNGREFDPIPLIYGIDSVHGNNNVFGSVIFPHNIGLGAARDTELIKKISKITAEETKAIGMRWTFSPCVAVVQDIRWGRTYESYGENVEIAKSYAAPAVMGLEQNGVISCAKHFIADGGTIWGTGQNFHIPDPWTEFPGFPRIDRGDAIIDESNLREVHLPPFEKAVKAGANTVMISFSSFQGMKMHENSYLISDVLKGELEFGGFVISDYDAIDALPYDTYYEKVVSTINAGVDMLMVTDKWKQFISELTIGVTNGDVSLDRIDDAVRRILKVKIKAGLLDNPYVQGESNTFGSKKHRRIAKEAVRKSLVLLKNEAPEDSEGKILPLSEHMKIYVAGKAANDIGRQCGGWTISWQGSEGDITVGSTILDGIKKKAGKRNPVTYSEDATNIPDIDYDVAVVVIGEKPYTEWLGDDDDLSLETAHITSVDQNDDGTLTVNYSDEDIQTLERVKAMSVPTVVIILSGRPIVIGDHIDNWDALVAAWLPGTEGAAVADVLFGDKFKHNFIGKLPFTWPKNMDYLNVEKNPENTLFPYDFGLEYD